MVIIFLFAAMAVSSPMKAKAEQTDTSDTEAVEKEAISSYSLETVVVTAEKRETRVRETPVAMTVFTSKNLEDNNLKTIEDVLARVPNLFVASHIGGNTQITFRGALISVGTETNPLVMYVDGVPVDSYAYLDTSLLDVERIEVLRGAQAALYGKNAFAGVVNVITKTPDNTSTGKVVMDAGSEYSYMVGATASGPVVEDKLFYSVSAVRDYHDGYMDIENSSDHNDEGNIRMKGQLRFLPSDGSSLDLHLGYTQVRQGPMPVVAGSEPDFTSGCNDTDYRDKDIFSMALHGSIDFQAIQLKSITTCRMDDMTASHDVGGYVPGGYYSEYDESSNEVTQELRLQSNNRSGRDLNWLVGIYGGYRDFDREKWYTPAWDLNYPYKEQVVEFAPFAQIETPLFVEALKLTTGLRWQYLRRKATIRTTMAGYTLYDAEPDQEWTPILPKLVLSYDLTDDHMIYAGVNRSFLPGGYNRQVTAAGVNTEYDPQYAWNYELGSKSSWLDNRMETYLTLFYSKYRDMHVLQWDVAAGGPVASNAGNVTAYGAEFEVHLQILPGLTGIASMGYTHAEFDEYTSLYGEDLSGNKVHMTPDYTGNLALVYRNAGGFMCQADVLYIDEIYWNAKNTDSRDAVTTVNAKVGYETNAFDIYLYITNLFDETYLTVHESSAADYGLVAPPREFGLQLVYRW